MISQMFALIVLDLHPPIDLYFGFDGRMFWTRVGYASGVASGMSRACVGHVLDECHQYVRHASGMFRVCVRLRFLHGSGVFWARFWNVSGIFPSSKMFIFCIFYIVFLQSYFQYAVGHAF